MFVAKLCKIRFRDFVALLVELVVGAEFWTVVKIGATCQKLVGLTTVPFVSTNTVLVLDPKSAVWKFTEFVLVNASQDKPKFVLADAAFVDPVPPLEIAIINDPEEKLERAKLDG